MADHSSESDIASALDGLHVRVIDVRSVWPSLRVGRTVPLGRLEWIWTLRGSSVRDSSTTARAVFNVSSSPALSESFHQQAHEWFRKPYLYILVVTLDELEVFRESAGWPRVRSFVEGCRERHLEYLVICVADDNAARVNRRVIERLRAEVNLTTRGRERVVTVPMAPTNDDQRPISHLHHSPVHQDLLVRLRECARDGVEARVQEYEAETGRLYSNRSSPNWSFLQYFALKEGMGFVFVQIGRRDLALRCYDELASLLNERTQIGTTGFGASAGADAAIGVVDPYAKDFRVMVLANTISELDFRTYLFARQATLLLADRKYSEVAERGLKFISVVARRAAEESAASPGSVLPVFRDAWVFRASRAMADALAPAIPSNAMPATALSKQLGTARERHTARLIAGFHVHALKAFSGLAQLCLPGTLVPTYESGTNELSSVPGYLTMAIEALSDDGLKTALQDTSKAIGLYSEIAYAAASLYEMGGRQRGAAALDGDAGVVCFRNKNFSEAEGLLSAQCSRFFEDQGWDQLHRRRRVDLANTEKELDRVQEYLVSCLTMLYMTRNSRRLGSYSPHGETAMIVEAASWAVEAVKATNKLPKVMKYKAEKLFNIYMRPNDEPWREGDSCSAIVVVDSDVPTKLSIDNIFVELRCLSPSTKHVGKPAASALRRTEVDSTAHSDDGASLTVSQSLGPAHDQHGSQPGAHELFFLAKEGPVIVEEGITEVKVSSEEVPRAGKYVVSLVSLVIGKLKLVQASRKYPTTPTVTTKSVGSPRPSSSAIEATGSQSEQGSSKSRFPCFFAIAREPAAKLSINCSERLFLIPQATQYIELVVTAGSNGLSAGARLAVAIALPASANSDSVSSSSPSRDCSVQLVPWKESVDTNDACGKSDLLRVLIDENGDQSKGEVIIERELEAGMSFSGRLGIRVLPEFVNISFESITGRNLKCIWTNIFLNLSCAELARGHKRSSFVEMSSTFSIHPPFSISSWVESSLGCDDIPALHAHAPGTLFDVPTLHGVLYCSLRSHVGTGKSLTLKRVRFVTPLWLEVRSDASSPHESLLPCKISNNGVFTTAFELQGRNNQTDLNLRIGSNSMPHGTDRTLPRIAASSDVDPSDLMVASESSGIGAFHESELEVDEPPIIQPVGSRDSRFTQRSIQEFEASPGEEYEEALKDLSFIESANEDAADEQALSPSAATMSLEQIEVDEPIGEAHDTRRDDASSSVVPDGRLRRSNLGWDGVMAGFRHHGNTSDLDSGADGRGRTRLSGDLTMTGNGLTLDSTIGRLCIEIELHSIAQPSEIEQNICVNGFSPPNHRYFVERICESTVAVGRPMVMRFHVTSTQSSFAVPEESAEARLLAYEVDADRSEWLVAGKKRGEVLLAGPDSDVGRVSLIPMKTGRLYLPYVKISERDGSSTRFENSNKCYQITVLPSSLVTSKCVTTPVPPTAMVHRLGGESVIRGALDSRRALQSVAVVPADAFFC